MMRHAFPVIILSIVLNFNALSAIAGDSVEEAVNPLLEMIYIDEQKLELQQAREEILVLKAILEAYHKANTHYLRLSAYTARKEECNDDIENTAIMQRPITGWTVAVSRDLRGWLGKRVYVEGFGIRMVSDLMNSRYSKSIDILVSDVSEAEEIGVRENVFVTLIEPLAQSDKGISWECLHFTSQAEP
ncbi:3D domain-containing protein [Desulfonatronum lacustre]|uniref:3D domain-containing protein n=1 Tax=Desulfonatronum lacustre TaxID=66849 RepID=UPI0004B44E60|nr:3D domain-containing protein [Desulfonatronum lacustre]